MSEITQLVIALVLSFLLDRFLKPYLLRKWLGVVMGGRGCGWLRFGRSEPLVGV
ncbi:hypothetical protein ACNT2N_05170 [Pseudomonas thivervalensis]|uniref:hypothetical protein n=1 Tax=Pseudomonas thivervalensis TaxID=86265 RepID=UPI00209667B5|nr:hypothetical protein [Pseudomonas thivervalensis]